ncbi:hypothetical protein [Candidiatus Paracoxiella cheracis]|uniref:hypothetical protein n=1 Tax=Candidiatus Paracoxiella cheracis TaxID=3405120 RepID=UPI003BF5F478
MTQRNFVIPEILHQEMQNYPADASHGEAKPMASIPRQPPIFDRAECRRNGVP